MESLSIKDIKTQLYQNLTQIREDNLRSNPLEEIDLFEINCNRVDSLLLDAYETDQKSREGMDTGIVDVDGKNQNTVVSILEECGWPSSQKSIEAVWLVLQHSDSKLISNYYPKFKELEKLGLIEKSAMALMEDRLLVSNDLPQIYGSQVGNDKLFDIKYPDKLNELRKSVNLEPIEIYTKRFGIEFDRDDYKK